MLLLSHLAVTQGWCRPVCASVRNHIALHLYHLISFDEQRCWHQSSKPVTNQSSHSAPSQVWESIGYQTIVMIGAHFLAYITLRYNRQRYQPLMAIKKKQ